MVILCYTLQMSSISLYGCTIGWLSQFSSVAQSCPTLCDPMNRSTPGLPVHHKLLEFTLYSPTKDNTLASSFENYRYINIHMQVACFQISWVFMCVIVETHGKTHHSKKLADCHLNLLCHFVLKWAMHERSQNSLHQPLVLSVWF